MKMVNKSSSRHRSIFSHKSILRLRTERKPSSQIRSVVVVGRKAEEKKQESGRKEKTTTKMTNDRGGGGPAEIKAEVEKRKENAGSGAVVKRNGARAVFPYNAALPRTARVVVHRDARVLGMPPSPPPSPLVGRLGLECLRLMLVSTFVAFIHAQDFADGYRSDFQLGEIHSFYFLIYVDLTISDPCFHVSCVRTPFGSSGLSCIC